MLYGAQRNEEQEMLLRQIIEKQQLDMAQEQQQAQQQAPQPEQLSNQEIYKRMSENYDAPQEPAQSLSSALEGIGRQFEAQPQQQQQEPQEQAPQPEQPHGAQVWNNWQDQINQGTAQPAAQQQMQPEQSQAPQSRFHAGNGLVEGIFTPAPESDRYNPAYPPAPTIGQAGDDKKQGFLDRLKSTVTGGDFLSRVDDVMAGWGKGSTPLESLAFGSAGIRAGNKERTNHNKTVNFLKDQGYSDTEAQAMAKSPNVLNKVIEAQMRSKNPDLAEQLKLKQLSLSNQKLEQELGAGGQNGVKMGAIPAGYELTRNPDTGENILRPIAGSEAAMKEAQAKQKEGLNKELELQKVGIISQDIDKAVDLVKNSWGTSGTVGRYAAGVAGTPAHDLSNVLMSLKANLAFDALAKMRAASPTGGALGAVSEKELALLEKEVGSLEQSQTAEQLLANLERIKKLYNGTIVNNLNKQAGQAQQSGLKVGQVVDGFEYIGGNENDQNSWKEVQ